MEIRRLQKDLERAQRERDIEKVFGTCKRSYGLRRMRWLGLAKAGLQVRLAAIAYNIRRIGRRAETDSRVNALEVFPASIFGGASSLLKKPEKRLSVLGGAARFCSVRA
jgi:Transposase DDE domain